MRKILLEGGILFQTLISVWVAFTMLFVNFVPGFIPPEDNGVKDYPYVFVHGLFGWGKDEGINEDIAYWGATAGNLMDELRGEGVECYDASVGPVSSNWDRACELYACLTGGTVDYGAAHSAANGHKRYGRTYDEPLIPDLGELDENGLVNKINLVGHSFGGNTIRLLAQLLADGCPEELAASPDDASDLFKGGKDDWINSVVTICTPNNGTTLYYIAEDLYLMDILMGAVLEYCGIMGRSFLNGYVDFHLEQFGLTFVPGNKDSEYTVVEALKLMFSVDDNAATDLSPDAAEKLNEMTKMNEDIYYFSYAFSTTKPCSQNPDVQVPIPSTLAILAPFASMMGVLGENRQTDYPIDESWRENDGLVNLKSALYPLGAPHKDYDAENIERGIWNVMPVSVGDHGSAIGLGSDMDELSEFYLGIVNMIDSLPSD